MGFCFVCNIFVVLNKSGYNSIYMEILEYINIIFVNCVFVDWFSIGKIDVVVSECIQELLLLGWSVDSMLEKICNLDVFIFMFGVVLVFFDKIIGVFVLLCLIVLNFCVLGEKYEYWMIIVQENVDNVLYLINFVCKLVLYVKVVIMVLLVLLIVLFEFEFCVVVDCLFKSIMCLVVYQVVYQFGLSNVLYWFFFEVFCWGGFNVSNFYVVDDGVVWYVLEEKVNGIIGVFIDMFDVGC